MSNTQALQNESFLDDLQYSAEYAEFIMDNAGSDRIICDGDSLLEAQEDGYLLDEFCTSIGIQLT